MAARLTAAERALREIPEATFQSEVLALAKGLGWRTFHAPANRPNPRNGRIQHLEPGFPDLVLVRGTRLVFAELKRQTGKTTPAQDAWLADLRATGQEAYVWRPADWPQIRETLRRLW